MLSRLLAPRAEAAYALLRAVSGLLFALHGLQKLFGVLGGTVQPAGSQLWIGAVIELAAGLAIAAGLFTTWAAFLASGSGLFVGIGAGVVVSIVHLSPRTYRPLMDSRVGPGVIPRLSPGFHPRRMGSARLASAGARATVGLRCRFAERR